MIWGSGWNTSIATRPRGAMCSRTRARQAQRSSGSSMRTELNATKTSANAPLCETARLYRAARRAASERPRAAPSQSRGSAVVSLLRALQERGVAEHVERRHREGLRCEVHRLERARCSRRLGERDGVPWYRSLG